MDKPSELHRRKPLSRLVKAAPPFVGRSQELDWLEHRLQEASAGRPHVILIPGEAGIGKTRLLQEVRSEALRRGLQVFYGRGYEDLTLPYLPFIETLRALVDLPSQDIEHTVRSAVEVINRLLHPHDTSSPAASPSTSVRSRQDQQQLLLAVSRVMMALVQRRPTLFVVDDLHWADRPSLDLFGHLVYTVADMAMYDPVPLLLIGTYRPMEPEEPLARLIARLQRETICQTLALTGLNESEIYELVQGMGLLRPSHQLIATISEVTQGNPLFVQEVLHHLIRQDALEERGGSVVSTAAAADLPLPAQVTSAIVARLHGLSEGCRRVLTLASFLGESFSFQTLGAVSGLSEDELLNLLEEGVRQHLLRSEGQTFQFVHSLIRQVFYHEPSGARRQRLHRQIAETLQCLYAEDLDAHVLEIAHHLVRAGQAADLETVAAYARRAGDRAFTAFAWSEAARYYEAALSAAEATGQLSPHDRAELHYWAGLAHYRDQDAGPSLEHYAKAIETYRLTGNIRGLAQALMDKTRIHYSLASVPFGILVDVTPLEETLEALGDSEPGLRGRISSILSGAYWVARQADKAEELALRALKLGQHLGDDRLCALASFQLGLAQLQDLRAREGVESWRNAVTYARQADDLWLQSLPLSRMPQALASLGRLDEAEAVGLSVCELTRETHAWGDHSFALAVLASVAVARGDFVTAERRAHEALLMMSRSGYSWSGALALPTLACARALRGTLVEANDALDLLVEPGRVFAEIGSVFRALTRALRQLVRAYAGAYDEVRLELEASPDLDVAKGPVDFSSLACFCALAETADVLGAPSMAERAYRALLLAAGQGMLFPSRWIVLIPRVLGVAATVNRWWDTAEAHFREAIKTATRIGTRPELGRSYLDYARMLIARGRKRDRRRAMELVRQAGPLFHELGMEPFARRAAQLAEALQTRIPTPARPRTAYPAHLSEREVQILFQIAQGCTNQEIADALVLSSTTVARHIGNLFHKIGVNSRSAATAYAFEHGLIAQLPPERGTTTTSALAPVAGAGKPPRIDVPPSRTQPLYIILVTDMEGSTALIQRLGDAQAYELLGLHNAILRDCLRRYQGTEVMHTGDGIEASFLSVATGIECAIAIQQAFAKHNQEHPNRPIRLRIGLNAGEPILTEGRLFGTAVHTAFRICARAQPGQILVSEVIYQLAAGQAVAFVNRGRFVLKGLPGRVRLYEVRWVDARK